MASRLSSRVCSYKADYEADHEAENGAQYKKRLNMSLSLKPKDVCLLFTGRCILVGDHVGQRSAQAICWHRLRDYILGYFQVLLESQQGPLID